MKQDHPNERVHKKYDLKNACNRAGRWMQEHCLVFSAGYSFLLFLAVYVLSGPKWEGSDDFMISGLLSGVTGESSPYVLTMDYLLACVILLLQRYLPQLNWLTILELFSVWISFLVLIRALLKLESRGSQVMALLVPVVFEISFYKNLHTTRSACLLAFSGLLLILEGSLVSRKKRMIIMGTGLVMTGYLFRHAVLLAVPFIGVYVIACMWKEWQENKSFPALYQKTKGFLLAVSGLTVLILALKLCNTVMYAQFDQTSDYRGFNKSRYLAMDYLADHYDTYALNYIKKGVTENDFEMLRYSMIYDKVFDENLFQRAAEVNGTGDSGKNNFDLKLTRFRNEFRNKLCYYNNGRYTGKRNLFPVYAGIAVFALFFMKRKNAFLILCFTGGTMVCAVYFVWMGRFPPWIQDSLVLIGSFTIISSICWEKPWLWRFSEPDRGQDVRRVLLSVMSVIVLASAVGYAVTPFLEQMQRDTSDQACEDVIRFLAEIEDDKAHIYIMDNFSNAPYPVIDAYGSLRGLEKGSWSNIVRVGSWFIGHPVYQAQLEKLGLDSPIRNLIDDDIFLITDMDSPNLRRYEIFFREHYQLDVCSKKVKQWGKYAAYVFELAQ